MIVARWIFNANAMSSGNYLTQYNDQIVMMIFSAYISPVADTITKADSITLSRLHKHVAVC